MATIGTKMGSCSVVNLVFCAIHSHHRHRLSINGFVTLFIQLDWENGNCGKLCSRCLRSVKHFKSIPSISGKKSLQLARSTDWQGFFTGLLSPKSQTALRCGRGLHCLQTHLWNGSSWGGEEGAASAWANNCSNVTFLQGLQHHSKHAFNHNSLCPPT